MVRDLGNVDETVHARNDLRKGTERRHADHFDGDDVAHFVVFLEDLPRIVLVLAIAERDLVFLLIEPFDEHLHGLADGQHVRGVLHAVPGQFRHVDHAVHAAEVHERAIGRHGFDNAGVGLTDFGVLPERLLALFTLLAIHRAHRAHRAAAGGIDLDHAETDRLPHQRGQIVHANHRRVGRRDEQAHAVRNRQHAALDDVGHGAVEDLAGLGCRHDGVPAFEGVDTFLGQHDGAFLVVGAHDEQFELIAHFDDVGRIDAALLRQFVRRDVAGLFAADHFDLHFVRIDLRDDTVHSFICI